MSLRSLFSLSVCFVVGLGSPVAADDPPAKPQRLLLLYQKPDGHPPQTHEYLA
jgi:hypothetical protein